MTRKRLEAYKGSYDLKGLCRDLSMESAEIHSYGSLKDYAVKQLEKDGVGLALWILQAIYEAPDGADFFIWDMPAGKCDSIKPICTFEDAERFLEETGFEEETDVQ